MTPTCWICGTALDAGGYEPLVRVVCRNCGQKNLLQRTFDHFVPDGNAWCRWNGHSV